VPCSGLGIIRKKPDIRYKDLEQTEGLPAIQLDILNEVSKAVRPGGTLIYSTCTVLRRENADVVQAFLADHKMFQLEPFALPEPIGETPGMVTLWPHIHQTDGFFIAKLRRAYV
jgi:16S rRNA (cytosine967-C5)-methyltransferase